MSEDELKRIALSPIQVPQSLAQDMPAFERWLQQTQFLRDFYGPSLLNVCVIMLHNILN